METTPHPFIKHPHKTLISLSIPVLFSLTAEPITALVDTAFISSLGVVPLAALGVGTTALSSLFWMFNFLGVGTQTEVAQRYGKGESEGTEKILSLALLLSALIGLILILTIGPTAAWLANLLGASGSVQENAVRYMQIRLFGAPAVLLTLTIFGALRGLQDMRSPLWIAIGVNVLNLLLDWCLIFGKGPFPAMGVGGSALASTISQWLGALAGIILVAKKIGLTRNIKLYDAKKILQIGGDMFVRTGILNIFLAYTTRVANNLGADVGAAHQVIRQVWVFTALALDAFASTVQSLVGFFIGKDSISLVKRVVRVANGWSIGTGIVLGILMWAGRDLVIRILVPASSVTVFLSAWLISALSQPINSIAFLTDGTHWGTGDFRYLRNTMLIASGIGILGLWLLENWGKPTLLWIWGMIAVWNAFRALFGWIRIWPGIGQSIFKEIQN
jgi:MATE family multidrug resistance protein